MHDWNGDGNIDFIDRSIELEAMNAYGYDTNSKHISPFIKNVKRILIFGAISAIINLFVKDLGTVVFIGYFVYLFYFE